MRRYESIYILRPGMSEEQVDAIIESTNKIITDDAGTIISLNKWGMKKLAYLVKKESQGYYVYCDFAGTPAAVAEFERRFRIEDSVLKYMTVKLSEAITAEQVQQAIGDIAAAEEAAAKEAAEAEEAAKEENAEEAAEAKTAE